MDILGKHICTQCGAVHENHSSSKPCKLCGGKMELVVLDYKKRILDIMQEMEGIYGPEMDEYIQIMGDIATEAEQRTQNAMRLRDEINDMLPDPVDDEFMDKAKTTFEEAEKDDMFAIDVPYPLGAPDDDRMLGELMDDDEEDDGNGL